MKHQQPQPLLSVREAAELLGVSMNFIYRHAKELPLYRVGIKLKFAEEELRLYFKQKALLER